jgi:nicotinamidase-related amidase
VPEWDRYLSERDRRLFTEAGFGRLGGFGSRPVILVIDVSYAFTGDRPEPIFQSIVKWPNSAGELAWDRVENIARLLEASRAKRLPIFYTTGPDAPVCGDFGLGRWKDKLGRVEEDSARLALANKIVEQIAPQANDIVIEKSKPSAFFATLFASYLVDLGADSIITCGVSTSGCVRASVVDGFSYNYKMVVVEDCTFDRGEASHAINLFDMHMKYADVVSLDAASDYIEALPTDLFIERMPALVSA